MSEKDCQSCKQKDTTVKQIGLIILGFWLLASSIYGTIHMFKSLIKHFFQT